MRLRSWALRLGLAGLCIGAASAVGAATLYTCVDARGIVRYSAEPCVNGQPPMAIDRIEPEERGMTREARIATEIEIAAMREGVDDALAPEDRQAIEALRADLAAPDARTRQRALRAWQAIYARYRIAARPSAHPEQRVAPLPRVPDAQGPLGRVVPGTQGPLVVAPAAPPALAPAGRAPLVADPATGRVLAPFGDRLVDPLTGTLWQRAGSVYVDPATGRVIPAP